MRKWSRCSTGAVESSRDADHVRVNQRHATSGLLRRRRQRRRHVQPPRVVARGWSRPPADAACRPAPRARWLRSSSMPGISALPAPLWLIRRRPRSRAGAIAGAMSQATAAPTTAPTIAATGITTSPRGHVGAPGARAASMICDLEPLFRVVQAGRRGHFGDQRLGESIHQRRRAVGVLVLGLNRYHQPVGISVGPHAVDDVGIGQAAPSLRIQPHGVGLPNPPRRRSCGSGATRIPRRPGRRCAVGSRRSVDAR